MIEVRVNKSLSAFHSTKYSGNSGWRSEWNSLFTEFHSKILGLHAPREVGLKFQKIRITGKFRSIRPFLLVHFLRAQKSNSTWLPQASHLICHLTVLLNIIVAEWPQQVLVSSVKIHVMWA